MRTLTQAILLVGVAMWAWPLAAQQAQSCSRYSIIIGSPEDKLMLAVNATADPSAKIAALEKFAQEHPDSTYISCVDELLTKNYVKLQQYDKAIAAGQKAVAAGFLDVSFLEDLLQAYIATGNAGDAAFEVIMKAAKPIQEESAVPKSMNESEEQFEQAKKAALQQAKQDEAYMAYALIALLPRVTNPTKQITFLDQFSQAYPEAAKEHASSINYRYAVAYAQANQPDKADEYAEKAIAADPNNIDALNMAAYDYAFRVRAKQDTAAQYANKVVSLIPTMKKPEGLSEDQFKTQQNTQEGMAHLTLGYLDLLKFASSHRVAGAVREFTKAADLLTTSPELQGQAYYLLGYSYETLYPAEHHKALVALERAVKLPNPMLSQAQELLARVRQVAR